MIDSDALLKVTTEITGGKWQRKIIDILLSGKKRFEELRKLVGTATRRMLTAQHRELRRDGARPAQNLRPVTSEG